MAASLPETRTVGIRMYLAAVLVAAEGVEEESEAGLHLHQRLLALAREAGALPEVTQTPLVGGGLRRDPGRDRATGPTNMAEISRGGHAIAHAPSRLRDHPQRSAEDTRPQEAGPHTAVDAHPATHQTRQDPGPGGEETLLQTVSAKTAVDHDSDDAEVFHRAIRTAVIDMENGEQVLGRTGGLEGALAQPAADAIAPQPPQPRESVNRQLML